MACLAVISATVSEFITAGVAETRGAVFIVQTPPIHAAVVVLALATERLDVLTTATILLHDLVAFVSRNCVGLVFLMFRLHQHKAHQC